MLGVGRVTAKETAKLEVKGDCESPRYALRAFVFWGTKQPWAAISSIE